MKALAFSGGKDSMACLHLLRSTLDCAIYVDTGFSYPETAALVEYARTIIPVHVVVSDRKAQNELEGLPADVVPIDWTRLGHTITGPKPVLVQSYLGCCYESISKPLLDYAIQIGVKELVYGQRDDEGHKSPARDGTVVSGIRRRHPIEAWSASDVLAYLTTKMKVPAHYSINHSSLDCYDCTAYRKASKDRVDWMRFEHPALFQRYLARSERLDAALLEAH